VARDGRWKPAAAALILALACAAVYANSLAVPFLFDDGGAILENPTIRSLKRIRRVLFPPNEGQTVQGRPIVNLTIALNYAWSKDKVWSYHLVNVAIHALAGICVFGIARQTWRAPVFNNRVRDQATFLGFAVALIWTLHPLQTESVTYVIQRAESLVGLLLLLTLYCSIRSANDPPGRGWQAAAVIACGAGMATKEVMAAAPLLVVLYDWAFSGQSLRSTLRRRWGFYLCLAGTWLILGSLLVGSHDRGGSTGLEGGLSSWEYLRTQFGFIVNYLRLAFWPHPLVFDYGISIATQPAQFILPGLVVVALFGCTVAALLNPAWRPAGFLGAWFFLILAPSSSVVPVVTQTGAEHRMYLPLLAVVAVTVAAAERLLGSLSRRSALTREEAPGASASNSDAVVQPSRSVLLWERAALCVVALALGIATIRRNHDYRSVVSIWEDVAAKCPDNFRAFVHLGEQAVASGEYLRGVEFFSEAIRLNPRDPGPMNRRGDAYMQLGDVEQARRDFQLACSIVPRKASYHFETGMARAAAGDLEGALTAFTRAASVAPASAPVHCQRGIVLARLARPAEAVQEFSEAINLNPDLVDAFRERAGLYLDLKDYDSARADLAELERLGSSDGLALAERLEQELAPDQSKP
jgi:Flp pilus assembly protein TadD